MYVRTCMHDEKKNAKFSSGVISSAPDAGTFLRQSGWKVTCHDGTSRILWQKAVPLHGKSHWGLKVIKSYPLLQGLGEW